MSMEKTKNQIYTKNLSNSKDNTKVNKYLTTVHDKMYNQ